MQPEPTFDVIQEVFRAIPSSELLAIAEEIRAGAGTGIVPGMQKDVDDWVTDADIRIQRRLVEYFESSSLAGLYLLKAEEEELGLNSNLQSDARWQLIIDPLDGTNMYRKGSSEWGTMIGWCDADGKLLHSWCLYSDGEVFSTFDLLDSTSPPTWALRKQESGKIRVDFCDYEAGAAERLSPLLEKRLPETFSDNGLELVSANAAIHAGRELYHGRCDALLWISSSRGKGTYPDYDLTYLGALAARGWKVVIGRSGGQNHIVVVAPDAAAANLLWEIGVEMLDPNYFERPKTDLFRDENLTITSPIISNRRII